MAKPSEKNKVLPERTIIAEKERLLDSIRGLKKVIRHGEQYFMSCTCKAAEITSDPLKLTEFLNDHAH